jgi:hypothetical protein
LVINGPFIRKRAGIWSITGSLKENGRIFGYKRAVYKKTGEYSVINGQFKRKQDDIPSLTGRLKENGRIFRH